MGVFLISQIEEMSVVYSIIKTNHSLSNEHIFMNDFSLHPITPKKVLFILAGLTLFVFLYSGFRGAMIPMDTFSLIAPSMDAGYHGDAMTNTISLGAPSARMFAKNMAIETSGAYGVATESMMPTRVDYSSAPAEVSKIVKSGNLTLLVASVDSTGQKIADIRTQFGGQSGNASFSEYGNGKVGDVTIWVPSDKFDEAMSAIKKLALRVNNENINNEDVSAQYIDLTSRLKNLKAAEAQYLLILKQSGKISDVLEVTRALNDTRGQIEQTQGQMDYLSRKVALSSIHISLSEEAVPGQVAHEWRPLTVVKAALKGTLSDLTDSIDLFLIFLVRLPLLLINLSFLVFIAWGLYRAGKYGFSKVRARTSTPTTK